MIKFITEDMLLTIKSNRKLLFENVVQSKKQTLAEAFHNDKIVKDTNIVGETFQLDMSSDKPELTDLENVKRVYNNMRSMSVSQASDERIWVAYTLSEFLDYMRYRWMPDDEVAMMNRYFFSYSPKRSLFRNGISRLWWIGYLTYDENRQNKYELTEYVCKKQDNINILLDINFANNPSIVQNTIQALIDAEKEGLEINRDTVRKLSEYINTLGGVYLVDAFSAPIIYEKCSKKIQHLLQK